MLGKMTKGQISACETRLQAAAKQTDKDKISRILMTNAYSSGDSAGWAKLVKRHLTDISKSDPDLCYKYAKFLTKRGPRRAGEVIKWSDEALENRAVWSGNTYVKRVSQLYKYKAASAQTLWKSAEEKYTGGDASAQASAERWRNETKTYAREWYEYLKSAGKDSTQALQLCIQAAGTADFCEQG
jgi:hypothetical protein